MKTLKLGLATYRLTKLAIDDEITESLRNKAYDLVEGHDKLTYLLSCPWCISIYAGAATVLIEYSVPQLNDLLASSALTGIIYTHLG